jgi:hypothetical protein
VTAATVKLLTEPELETLIHREVSKPLATPSEASPSGAAEYGHKIRRLARGLLASVASPSRVVLFGELEPERRPALWLTVALASALGAMIEERVHVLVVSSRKGQRVIDAETEGYVEPYAAVIESLKSSGTLTRDPSVALERRLRELGEEGRKVFVHLEEAAPWLDLFANREDCAGLVVLPRAQHTRKAALESFYLRLQQLSIPLLGAVLLDRQYPIPEALYRLL